MPRSLASLRTGGAASGARPVGARAGVGGRRSGRRSRRGRPGRQAPAAAAPRRGRRAVAAPAECSRPAWRSGRRRPPPRSSRRRAVGVAPFAASRSAGAVPDGDRGQFAGVRVGVDGDDRRADLDRHTRFDEQLVHPAGERRRQFDGGLGGLDLDHDLVDGQGVADRDPPAEHLRLGQSLADVGHRERLQPTWLYVVCHVVLDRSVGQHAVDGVAAPCPGRAGTRPPAGSAGRGCRSRPPAAPARPASRTPPR